MDEDLAQVAVASFTDAGQLRIAAGRALLRHQTHPGGKLSPLMESSTVAYRSHNRGCDQRADVRDLPEPLARRNT
jgi:hypothetical protein